MAGQVLQSVKSGVQSWFAKAPKLEINEGLEALPSETMAQLSQNVQALSVPMPYQSTIEGALSRAFQEWQEQPEINNSLVILGSPVDAIAPTLETILKSPTSPSQPPEAWRQAKIRFPLEPSRSADPLTILDELRKALDRVNLEDLETLEQEDAQVDPEDGAIAEAPTEPIKSPTIVVIPNLERYFLRCIQGWESVEYVQNLVAHEPSYFWVLGCSHWTWAFLDRVCHISAYLEQVESLPQLTGEELEQWLTPLMASAAATINPSQAPDDSPPASETGSETDSGSTLDFGSDGYWNSLANLSSGISTTAAQLCLQSLRMQAEDLANNQVDDTQEQTRRNAHQTEAVSDPSYRLRLKKPTLPSLIDLDSMDRYLLHALLIHGKMMRSHLALSLGEAEQTIRPRVQVLRREGVIIQQGVWLWVHPVHYPKLRNELGNNNFLIGEA
ncbi:MAG: hypothetical protein AAGD25_11675 [Cyanobacteria bacterium P01_F01_bin.150]